MEHQIEWDGYRLASNIFILSTLLCKIIKPDHIISRYFWTLIINNGKQFINNWANCMQVKLIVIVKVCEAVDHVGLSVTRIGENWRIMRL
jgi:hypothetical protein